MRFIWVVTILLLFFFTANAKTLKNHTVPWFKDLPPEAGRSIHVCGNADIRPTARSLKKDFLVGTPPAGYLLSGLLPFAQYQTILKEKGTSEAKTLLDAELRKARLWKYTDGGFENLGAPTQVELSFTASIKDCVEDAKTTLENDCSHYTGANQRTCCGQKFADPVLTWDSPRRYALLYGWRLKVPGEYKHRYCTFGETIQITD